MRKKFLKGDIYDKIMKYACHSVIWGYPWTSGQGSKIGTWNSKFKPQFSNLQFDLTQVNGYLVCTAKETETQRGYLNLN